MKKRLGMATARTIISIPEETKAWLESYSKTHGVSMAEAIRRGIFYLRKEEEKNTLKQLLKQTSGLWFKGDGLHYQVQLRSEWEKR